MLSIAIIGRPNVGKSTLFNRLVGKRLALVDDRPGVTRDRREAEMAWGELKLRLVDTAGLEESAPDSLSARMQAQSETAIERADLCLFVVDARAGVTPADRQFAAYVRRTGTPVFLLANKSEGMAGEAGFWDSYALGLGDPIAVSAEHGDGLSDLYQNLRGFCLSRMAKAGQEPDQSEPVDGTEGHGSRALKIAILGRPNAGKSTLANCLLGEERLLTGPEAGITRDAIALNWRWRDRDIALFDTAGMRRRAKRRDRLEQLSVGDTLNAVRFAELVILVLDAAHPFDKQDLALAEMVAREGRSLVVAVNKWDLVRERRGYHARLTAELDRLLPQLKGAALVTISGLTGHGTAKLMEAVLATEKNWNRRITTAELNMWLAEMTAAHPPPMVGGRRIRLRYITQPNARPPTFVAFSQRGQDLPQSYTRYLINGLRAAYDFSGAPIRLHVRTGDNPYIR